MIDAEVGDGQGNAKDGDGGKDEKLKDGSRALSLALE
jgi:hypothetical protein